MSRYAASPRRVDARRPRRARHRAPVRLGLLDAATAARPAGRRARGPGTAGRCRAGSRPNSVSGLRVGQRQVPPRSTTIWATGPASSAALRGPAGSSPAAVAAPRPAAGRRRHAFAAGRPRHLAGRAASLQVDRREQVAVAEQHLGLAEEQDAGVGQGEVEPARGCCAWVSALKYIRVLRQTSRSTREIGASCTGRCGRRSPTGAGPCGRRSRSPPARSTARSSSGGHVRELALVE